MEDSKLMYERHLLVLAIFIVFLYGCENLMPSKKEEPKSVSPQSQPPAPAQPAPAQAPVAPPSQSPQQAQSVPPTDAKLNLQQGMNYMRTRDWDNAINEFTLAIQKYPQYDTAYSNRAVAYMQQKKFNKAMDDLKEADKINPKNPNTHYNFTCWYSLQNQLDRALDSLDKALQYGFTEYDALRNDPDLSNVRKHPEFRKILEKHKVFLKQMGS